jgi:hypothetical protein
MREGDKMRPSDRDRRRGDAKPNCEAQSKPVLLVHKPCRFTVRGGDEPIENMHQDGQTPRYD